MAKTRETETNHAPERKKRVPMSGGARSVLAVENKDPNYHYRWVNDKEGRIQRFQDAYYEFVPHDTEVGERTVDSADSPDSLVSKQVGGRITAYLMRIKREYFEEDEAAKNADVDKSEESLFRKLNEQGDGSYGNVNFDRK